MVGEDESTGDYNIGKQSLLSLTASLLKSSSPREFFEKEGFHEILWEFTEKEGFIKKEDMQFDIEEVLGPPVEIEGKTTEECYQAEIQAIKQAIILWLQAPIDKKAPFLDKNLPEKYHKEFYGLSPRQRFLMFTLSRALLVKEKKEMLLPAKNDYARMFGALISDSIWFLEKCYLQRQKEYSTEIIPIQKTTIGELKKWPPGMKEACVIKDLFFFKNPPRFLGYRYSSRWVLPLVWAEILYCVQNNIPAQFCKTCGSLFVAESPTQDYRQVYCSPECRKKAKKYDPSQEKEAQRLYKAFLRGKISAEEYVKLAQKKGLRIIGGKHKDSKLKPFLKNSST